VAQRPRGTDALEHFLEEAGYLLGLLLGGDGTPTRGAFFDQEPGGEGQPKEKRYTYGTNSAEEEFVPANQFLETVEIARRAGHYRFIGQVAPHIARQSVGRFVSPCAVFFQAFHHDPIEIAINCGTRSAECAVGLKLVPGRRGFG
jgi:hypothetical protein